VTTNRDPGKRVLVGAIDGGNHMQSPKRLLVYFDSSKECRAALSSACVWSNALSAEVHVLIVTDIESTVACMAGVFDQLSRKNNTSSIESFANQAMQIGWAHRREITMHFEGGEPADCLLRKAEILDVCAIFVGDRRVSWLRRIWETDGVVSSLLGRRSGRTVVAVPDRSHRAGYR
jgi:nucleotide-binding universal stress UspA family protein